MIQTTMTKINIPSTVDELPKHSNAGFEKFVKSVGDGILKPGTVMTQAQLCDFLGMSLTPLRETIVLLEEYGLVEIKQRTGITIINPELSFVRDNYQFRIMIEIEALKVFVNTVTEDWLTQVRARHEELIAQLKKDSRDAKALEGFVALDQFVHSSIVGAMGNKSVLSTHNRLQQNIRMARAKNQGPAYANLLLQAGAEHLELLDRVEAQDHEGAAQCLRRHFESSIYRTIVAGG